MAVDITPLYGIVQAHIPCDVYDGNLGFTPIDFSKLSVIFTLLTAASLSTPKKERKEANAAHLITEVWSRAVEYTYQLDIYRQVTVEINDSSPTPPFEYETFTVVDSINKSREEVSKLYNFSVLPPSDINFTTETVGGGIACHRATTTFNILAESLVKFISNTKKADCVKSILQPLRPR